MASFSNAVWMCARRCNFHIPMTVPELGPSKCFFAISVFPALLIVWIMSINCSSIYDQMGIVNHEFMSVRWTSISENWFVIIFQNRIDVFFFLDKSVCEFLMRMTDTKWNTRSLPVFIFISLILKSVYGKQTWLSWYMVFDNLNNKWFSQAHTRTVAVRPYSQRKAIQFWLQIATFLKYTE